MLATVPAVALLLSASLSSASLDLNALVSAETRAGETPVRPGDPSTRAVVGILGPGVEAQLAAPELSLRLGYGVRFYALGPNSGLPATAPLDFHVAILHLVNLAASARLSRTLTVTGLGTASIGEPDYSALSAILGPTPQGTLPAVQKILAVSGRLLATYRASPRWDLGLALEAFRYHPYGSAIGPSLPGGTVPGMPLFVAPPLADQTLLRAAPSAAAHVSRRSDLLLLGSLSRLNSSGSTAALTAGSFQFLVASAELGWREQLSRLAELRVHGGVARGWQSGAELPGGGGVAVSPVGGVEIGSWLPGQDEPRLRGVFSTVVDYFVDPSFGAAGPRSITSLSFSMLYRPDTTVGLDAIFSTVIRSQPIVENPDETVVTLMLPVRHRLSDVLFIEGGLRGSDRGPNLSAPSFAFHQRELWVYLRLTATTRSRGGVRN